MTKLGKLFHNKYNDRMDIIFSDGETYGGLHCGECFEAKVKGKWIQTRIEMSNDWYLVESGLIGIEKLNGIPVRI